MAIKILNIKYKDENEPANSFNALHANVANYLKITIRFEVSEFVTASTSEPIILNNNDGYVGGNWITDASGRFEPFNIGDLILIYDYKNNVQVGSTAFLIIDKINNDAIQVQQTLAFNNLAADNIVISLANDPTKIKYYTNFIENSAAVNFNSSIDGSEQVYYSPRHLATDTVVEIMQPQGSKCWQQGVYNYVALAGVEIKTYPIKKYIYEITHVVRLTEYILVEQLQNQLLNLPPAYFENNNALKHVFKIEVGNYYSNAKEEQIFDTILGNTGWYNEHFNTSNTNYKIKNLFYTCNGKTVNSIVLSSNTFTKVAFQIENTLDNPFINLSNNFAIFFHKVPSDEYEYRNNNTYADENFVYYNIKYLTLGNGVYPNSLIFKNYEAIRISSSLVTIQFEVHLTQADVNKIKLSTTPRYVIGVDTQDKRYLGNTDKNDRVTLLIDFSEFSIFNFFEPVIKVEQTKFLQHPDFDFSAHGLEQTAGIGTLPAILVLTPSIRVGTPSYMFLQNSVGEIYGAALWAGDLRSTLTAITNSINTGTIINGQIIHNGTPIILSNSKNIIAEYTGTDDTILLKAPIILGASMNGYGGTHSFNSDAESAIDTSGTDFVNGVSSTSEIDIFPNDELVAYSKFYQYNSAPLEIKSIYIESIECKVIAKSTASHFDLENYTINTTAFPIINNIQQIDVDINRPFQIPNTEIRRWIKIERRNDLDTAGKSYFTIKYPFLFRWEYWEALQGVDNSFFDKTKPMNGFNHWWYRYDNASFDIFYRLRFNVLINGIKQQFDYDTKLVPHDYASNPDYSLKKIEVFDYDNNASLLLGAKAYIKQKGKTLVRATFIKSTPFVRAATVAFDMEVWEGGNIYSYKRYSSRWPSDGNTWFESILNNDKIKITVTGNTVIAEALINGNLLPQNISSYKITARCYEYITEPIDDGGVEVDGGLLTNDDRIQILTNDDRIALTVNV